MKFFLDWSVILSLAAIAAGIYELVAVGTNVIPTISEGIWAAPVWVRLVLLGGTLLAGLDHFVTRRWL